MNRCNCNTLRIDAPDGSSVVEYRIRHDSVETRTWPAEQSDGTGNEWQRLTPQQIDHHITRSTIVAYWLRRRIGVRRLIQTCSDAMSGLSDPNAVHLLVRKLASLPQERHRPNNVTRKPNQPRHKRSSVLRRKNQ